MLPEDEVEVIMHATEDQKEVTVIFRSKKPMSTVDVCGELEFLANEMSRADDQLNQPGVRKH